MTINLEHLILPNHDEHFISPFSFISTFYRLDLTCQEKKSRLCSGHLQDTLHGARLDHLFQMLPNLIPCHAICPHGGRDGRETTVFCFPCGRETFHENPATVHDIGKVTEPLDRGENRQFPDIGVSLAIIANPAKGLQIIQTVGAALALGHNMITLQSIPITNPTSPATAVVAGNHGFADGRGNRLFASHDHSPC